MDNEQNSINQLLDSAAFSRLRDQIQKQTVAVKPLVPATVTMSTTMMGSTELPELSSPQKRNFSDDFDGYPWIADTDADIMGDFDVVFGDAIVGNVDTGAAAIDNFSMLVGDDDIDTPSYWSTIKVDQDDGVAALNFGGPTAGSTAIFGFQGGFGDSPVVILNDGDGAEVQIVPQAGLTMSFFKLTNAALMAGDYWVLGAAA